MTKIVVTNHQDFTEEQSQRLNSLGDVTYHETLPTGEEYLERIKGADIICSGTAGLQDVYAQLKDVYITVGFISVAFVDMNVLKNNKVTISNAPGANRYAVSEWIIGMMIMMARKLDVFLNHKESLRKDGKLPPLTPGLAEKSVTILGKGNIGSRGRRSRKKLGHDDVKKWLNKSSKTSPVYRRKKLIIMTAIALVGLGILLAIVLSLTRDSRQPDATLTLHKNPNAQAATYNNVPIIEACNVVSLDELRSKGIQLKGAQSPDIFVRTYIEGTTGASLPDHLAISDRPNSCHYYLQNGKYLFDIAIYQPSYSDMEMLEADIAADYNPQPDIGDLKVYKAKTYRHVDKDFFNAVTTNKDNEDFIVRKGDAALWFRLREFKQTTRQEVLHLIAANFSKLLQKPEARVTVDYRDSPLRDKLYKACELMTAEDATLLLGPNMSPVVKEGYGGAPGERNYETSNGRPSGYPYVAQQCERSATDDRQQDIRLTLELRQYVTEEGAKHFIQGAASGENSTRSKWQTVESRLGDEAYVDHEDVPNGDTIYVRKGALVLTLYNDLNSYDETKVYRTNEQLRSVITKVLERIEQ